MDFDDIVGLVFQSALKVRRHMAVALVVHRRRVDVTLRDLPPPRRHDPVEAVQTDHWVNDHRVSVGIRGGQLRVHHSTPSPGGGRDARGQQVPLDDADAEVVARLVGEAIEAGRTPF